MYDILTLNYEYPPLGGGASSVTADLAQEFAARGHHVDIVTMRYDEYPRIEDDSGVTVYRTPSLRKSKSVCRTHEMLSFLPTGFCRAVNLLRKHKYDVIHAHFLIPTGIISAILSKMFSIPSFVTTHGSDVPNYNPDRFTRMHRIMKPIWRRIVYSHDVIVSPSEYLASLIRKVASPAELVVIPNGFDPKTFDTATENERKILVSSRHFERKGIQHFFRALAHVETSWDVIITGEGPYTDVLMELANELGIDVEFVGWITREKLNDLIESSAIYVFPSSHENCPVALQEAMAAGCAIITSKYGGSAELIGDAGRTIDPTETDTFARALQSLLDNPEERELLQKRASTRIQSKYSWDRITTKYETLISELKNT